MLHPNNSDALHLQQYLSNLPSLKKSHQQNLGTLTVNSTSGSSIFFSFYEAQKPRTPIPNTPILIWLQVQGGPVVLERNPGSWNQIFGVVFLDNPIGTGFSIASRPEEIPRIQHDVAKHIFIAMKEFVGLDKLFENRPIYVTGESYAGKYVPAFGYYTLKKNEGLPKSRRLNLAGVDIGNWER
ncbi:hypothetical protein BC332_23071 [Capsicum chinense]|nr:putative pentatricopeptide repeat-containing protein, mitochondrial-like [Capsicum annuum]KAF3685566.1 putative pentatricopeptide repeat-containing protein, mitochondrial-like [Capsicum annuum]PHU06582.1 hypothetical protein BC332_23071 [Capsicum chinense]